jgi:hypothetical protein
MRIVVGDIKTGACCRLHVTRGITVSRPGEATAPHVRLPRTTLHGACTAKALMSLSSGSGSADAVRRSAERPTMPQTVDFSELAANWPLDRETR